MSGTYRGVRTERSAILLAAIFLFLSLVISGGIKSSPEFQITNDPHNQRTPSISGSYVVWEDNRNGNDDIYGFNLETQEEFRITWDSSNQKYPDISGTLVVWRDDRHHTNWEIYGCDLSRNEEIRITENGYDQKCPRVSGNIVVWIEKRNGKDAVYGCDLSSNREFRVCKDTYPCEFAPSGNTVVFLEWVHSDRLIGVYNVSTGRKAEIEAADDGMDIDFEGNIIVWAEMSLDSDSNPKGSIFGYDLSTDRLLYIFSGRGTRMCPRIYGDTVVWEYYRNGNWDIRGCSIQGVPFHILHSRPPMNTTMGY